MTRPGNKSRSRILGSGISRSDKLPPLVGRWVLLGLLCWSGADGQLFAQVQSGGLRPFVTGIIPVVGRNGAVGGVSVTPTGQLQAATRQKSSQLRTLRSQLIGKATGPAAKLRKVSLRGLERELRRHVESKQPLTPMLQHLAGLQAIEFLVIDAKRRDIILAGPATALSVANNGAVVGKGPRGARPVLNLDDFIVALRSIDEPDRRGITCSIDPMKRGIEAFQRWQNGQISRRPISLGKLEKIVGPQLITITGVPGGSRFARVMVAADFEMKRLALGLTKAPAAVRLPSYLRMLTQANVGELRPMPRWWLEMSIDRLECDPSQETWRVPHVQVRARSDEGEKQAAGARPDPVTVRWADAMTKAYPQLAVATPVFGELRNCMELSVVAALLVQENLLGKADLELPLLLETKQLQPATYHVPQVVASRGSLLRHRGSTLVSVSGGVQLDWRSAIKNVKTNPALQRPAVQPTEQCWWWD